MNILFKKINNILVQQYSIAEVFLATSLVSVAAIFSLAQNTYDDFIPWLLLILFWCVVFFSIIINYAFNKKHSTDQLQVIQWVGVMFICPLSGFYVFSKIFGESFYHLHPLEYIFILFGLGSFIRLMWFLIAFFNPRMIKEIPPAKNNYTSPIITLIITIICIFIYYTLGLNNFYSLIYSLFTGLITLDVISIILKLKTKIRQ